MKKINTDIYASVYKTLAEEVGEEATRKIHKLFKGQQIVFPSRLYSAEYIAKRIICEHDAGKTVREIAASTGYTDRRIRQILRNNREKEQVNGKSI